MVGNERFFLFLSFHSCHTMKPGKSCQALFKIGLLKGLEPQSLMVLMMLFLTRLVLLMS
jgi:hypothetical protein